MSNESSILMAQRLKKLRKEKNISHVSLSNAIKEKYGIEISRDSLMSYEVSDPNHTKAYKNEGMRVEYLRCFADFYGVSADYLMGLSGDPAPKPCAVDELGLSNIAIESLKKYTKEHKWVLSRLIEHELFIIVCDRLSQYAKIPNSEKSDFTSDDYVVRYFDFEKRAQELESTIESGHADLEGKVKVLIGYKYSDFLRKEIVGSFEHLLLFFDSSKSQRNCETR